MQAKQWVNVITPTRPALLPLLLHWVGIYPGNNSQSAPVAKHLGGGGLDLVPLLLTVTVHGRNDHARRLVLVLVRTPTRHHTPHHCGRLVLFMQHQYIMHHSLARYSDVARLFYSSLNATYIYHAKGGAQLIRQEQDGNSVCEQEIRYILLYVVAGRACGWLALTVTNPEFVRPGPFDGSGSAGPAPT